MPNNAPKRGSFCASWVLCGCSVVLVLVCCGVFFSWFPFVWCWGVLWRRSLSLTACCVLCGPSGLRLLILPAVLCHAVLCLLCRAVFCLVAACLSPWMRGVCDERCALWRAFYLLAGVPLGATTRRTVQPPPPPYPSGDAGKTGRNPWPPASVGPTAQTATGKLNPPPRNRHRRGGGTLDNPIPLTHDPTKPARRTAQPAEAEPNPTGWAASSCVYINHTTHGARAQPAATHNPNSDPASHIVCRTVRPPAQGGQREEQAQQPL